MLTAFPPLDRVRWDEADEDIRVRVPNDQSLSGRVGTESCGRRGNAGSEA
jgi:hypothetical protein